MDYLPAFGVDLTATAKAMNPLVPLVLFAHKYPAMFDDERMEDLYLLGVRAGRFSKHSVDPFALDGQTILSSSSGSRALETLVANIDTQFTADNPGGSLHFTPEELLSYGYDQRNLALFYAAWTHRKGACDWESGQPLNYVVGAKTCNGKHPVTEFHHVVPLGYARDTLGADITKDRRTRSGQHQFINSLANVVLVESDSNRAYANRAPKVALANTDPGYLAQQRYSSASRIGTLAEAEAAIFTRAQMLAARGGLNWFIDMLL
jgi:hypothetical protein